MLKKKNKGFTLTATLLALVVVIVLAFGGWYVLHRHQSQPPATSSLSGTVSLGPTQPVCRVPCEDNSEPVANHTIEIFDSSGKIVATTKTDDKGYYYVKLAPGHYAMRFNPPVGLGGGLPNKTGGVDVHDGANTLNVNVDSGIR